MNGIDCLIKDQVLAQKGFAHDLSSKGPFRLNVGIPVNVKV